MADERTYIMVKPDGVQRGLVGVENAAACAAAGRLRRARTLQPALQRAVCAVHDVGVPQPSATKLCFAAALLIA